MLISEARSKCEHIANVPLRPATAQELHKLYLAKGALATTAIEGNTLSEEQVLKLLEDDLHLPPSEEYLAREVNNIIQACNRIVRAVRDGRSPLLTLEAVKDFNQQVLRNLPLDEDVVPGQVRKHSVVVARYRAAPAEDCEHLLDRLCRWLSSEDFQPKAGQPDMDLPYAIIKAIVAHLYLAWIHPFADGNGRTARLVEFLVLISSGVPQPAAHLLSNHYNQTRSGYYRQLDQASRSGGDVVPFLTYAVHGFVDGLRAQLDLIRSQQWDVAWENYVHDQFRNRTSPSDERRRHLVLDLSDQAAPVLLSRLTQVSPRVAAEYAARTPKTVARDVAALVAMALLEQTPTGYRANKDLVLAFLPLRRQPQEAAKPIRRGRRPAR